jgi:NAD(P)-dependent dehydrogenase (short-subunit alcohol dehydrogenase family)
MPHCHGTAFPATEDAMDPQRPFRLDGRVVILLSQASSYVTGSTLVVDDGMAAL